MANKILFVCYGNVARSQMAESYYNALTGTHDAQSAGVSADSIDRYRHPVGEIVKVMHEDGIDISKNVVKKITPQLVEAFEKIIILCDISDCPRYLTDSKKIEHCPIPDPYGLGIEFSRSVRNEIKTLVMRLIED